MHSNCWHKTQGSLHLSQNNVSNFVFLLYILHFIYFIFYIFFLYSHKTPKKIAKKCWHRAQEPYIFFKFTFNKIILNAFSIHSLLRSRRTKNIEVTNNKEQTIFIIIFAHFRRTTSIFKEIQEEESNTRRIGENIGAESKPQVHHTTGKVTGYSQSRQQGEPRSHKKQNNKGPIKWVKISNFCDRNLIFALTLRARI